MEVKETQRIDKQQQQQERMGVVTLPVADTNNAVAVFSRNQTAFTTTMKEIDFHQTFLGDSVVEFLLQTLQTNTTLSSLNLDDNVLMSQSGPNLGLFLETNSTLKILSLNGNALGDVGLKSIARAFRRNNTLGELWLRENNITDKGVRELVDAIDHSNNDALFTIVLRRNRVSDGLQQRVDTLLSPDVRKSRRNFVILPSR